MTKKNWLLVTAILLFLVLSVALIFLITGKEHSYTIDRENSTGKEAIKKENKMPDNNNASKKENEAKNYDLTWAVERHRGKEVSKITTDKKIIAFTFDAGSNADGVSKILSILAENNVKGTFFLTGKFIEKYPDKVNDIIASGGDIGNHTYDHPYLTSLTNDQVKSEIKGAEDALGKLNAKFKPFLRAPYGDRNQNVLNEVSDNRYINIRWTIDSLGWKGTSGGVSKDLVKNKVVGNAAPGAIIMMHLGSNPDDKTHLDSEALPDIIPQLRSSGYEFVTLSELIELQK